MYFEVASLAVPTLGVVDNPFDHTTPDISVFGVEFSNKLYLVLGGLWGAAFVFMAAMLIRAFVKFVSARKVQHNPDALEDASKDLQIAGVGTAGLAGVGVIFAALVKLFG